MSKYSEMSDEQLRVEIAERLGWRSIGYWTSEDPPDAEDMYGVPPDGERIPLQIPRRLKPLMMTTTDFVPNWPIDLNAALPLLPLTLSTMMWHDGSGWNCRLSSFPTSKEIFVEISAATLARAICEAWLLFQDAQELENQNKGAK